MSYVDDVLPDMSYTNRKTVKLFTVADMAGLDQAAKVRGLNILF